MSMNPLPPISDISTDLTKTSYSGKSAKSDSDDPQAFARVLGSIASPGDQGTGRPTSDVKESGNKFGHDKSHRLNNNNRNGDKHNVSSADSATPSVEASVASAAPSVGDEVKAVAELLESPVIADVLPIDTATLLPPLPVVPVALAAAAVILPAVNPDLDTTPLVVTELGVVSGVQDVAAALSNLVVAPQTPTTVAAAPADTVSTNPVIGPNLPDPRVLPETVTSPVAPSLPTLDPSAATDLVESTGPAAPPLLPSVAPSDDNLISTPLAASLVDPADEAALFTAPAVAPVDAEALAETLRTAVASSAPTGAFTKTEDLGIDTAVGDKAVGPMTDSSTSAALNALSPQRTEQSQVTAPIKAPAITGALPQQSAEPYKQIASIIAPLRQMGDGAYNMTLRLNPAHLGSVEVAVSLNNGQISMQMSSDNAASRQMLRDSMNELRSSLQSSGLDTGSLDVGAGKSEQQHSNNSNSAGRSPDAQWTAAESDNFFSRLASVAPVQTGNDGGPLDVRV